MDEPTRRAWSKPELIVLVRSGPEEAVLAACKWNSGGPGEGGSHINCALNQPECGPCTVRSAS